MGRPLRRARRRAGAVPAGRRAATPWSRTCARLGGFGVAAHPGSSRRTGCAGATGTRRSTALEWLNADSEWRDRPRGCGARRWPIPGGRSRHSRRCSTVRSSNCEQWDRLAARRPVVGLAAHDAHARLGAARRRGAVRRLGGVRTSRPTTPMFASFSNVVRSWRAVRARPPRRRGMVRGAVRAGRVYSVVTGMAQSGRAAIRGRQRRPARRRWASTSIPRGAVAVDVRGRRAAGRAHVACLRRPRRWPSATAAGSRGRPSGVPGACRAEVRCAGPAPRVPWLVTNPIYVRAAARRGAAAREPAGHAGDDRSPGAHTPAHGRSNARPTPRPARDRVAASSRRRSTFAWRLGPAAQAFAAMQLATPADLARLRQRWCCARRADRPMRVWVQLRVRGGDGRRWGRSVYLDASAARDARAVRRHAAARTRSSSRGRRSPR